jgi:hypothetical protein
VTDQNGTEARAVDPGIAADAPDPPAPHLLEIPEINSIEIIGAVLKERPTSARIRFNLVRQR